MKRILTLLIIIVICSFVFLYTVHEASATVINFDDQGLTGPSGFGNVGYQAQQVLIQSSTGTIEIDNGVILSNTVSLPADITSVYGTCKDCMESFLNHPPSTLDNPLHIIFPSPINNLFLDVYNGLSQDIEYKMWDNAGNASIFTLAQNIQGGTTQIGFAAAGSEVFIEALTSGTAATMRWNFYIDNIHFDEPLPGRPLLDPVAVPEPATAILMGASLLGMGFMRKRSKRSNINS